MSTGLGAMGESSDWREILQLDLKKQEVMLGEEGLYELRLTCDY